MNDRPSEVSADYAILGCGSVGHFVARELRDQGKELIIFDRDTSRVEALRDQDMNAVQKDVTDDEIPGIVSSSSVALILTSDADANEEAVRNLRDELPDQYIVARATDPVSEENLKEAGADFVMNPSQVIAESALRALESGEMEHRVERLLEIIGEGDDLAVVIYRSFEPDEIGSAAALAAIADGVGVNGDVFYCGSQRHQRSEAFANLLELDVDEQPDDGFSSYDTVAVVDSADRADEFDFGADILIDHNPPDTEPAVEYSDVRGDVGSTSTVLTKYVQEVGFDVPNMVHTGLLHGIRSETSYFRRNTTPSDLTAAAYLFALADKDLLERLESPSMASEAFDVLAEAIDRREVHGSYLLSNVGFVASPDSLSWSAETLLSLEGVTTTVVFGITDDEIQIAGRSKDARVSLASIFEDAFADEAETIGHSDEARSAVPLGIFRSVETEGDEREALLEIVDETIKTKLFSVLNVEEGEGD